MVAVKSPARGQLLPLVKLCEASGGGEGMIQGKSVVNKRFGVKRSEGEVKELTGGCTERYYGWSFFFNRQIRK